MANQHVVVIGAGSTGTAIAHDLALRGLRVTLIDRFGPASGTTGHNQAQLHSGARYAVTDPASVRECIEPDTVWVSLCASQPRAKAGITLKGVKMLTGNVADCKMSKLLPVIPDYALRP